MENKKTTELLDLLGKNTGDAYDSGLQDELIAELRKRSPFFEILDPDWDEGIPAILVKIAELEDEVKKLKRHKHDPQTGDVLIRI